MNGRFDPTPFTGTELPASSPRAQTFRPLRGRSRTLVLSITCPREEVDASTRGAVLATSMDSVTAPGWSVIDRLITLSTWRTRPLLTSDLKPVAATVTE